jgi:hypothetical protein
METRFWDALNTHPSFIAIVIFGGIFAIRSFLSAAKDIHEMLGFKTKSELERDDSAEQRQHNMDKINDINESIDAVWIQIKEMNKANGDMRKALILGLGESIAARCHRYNELRYIPFEEIRYFREMFDTYTCIGGNHGIDQLFKKTIDTLPLKSQEEILEENERKKTQKNSKGETK